MQSIRRHFIGLSTKVIRALKPHYSAAFVKSLQGPSLLDRNGVRHERSWQARRPGDLRSNEDAVAEFSHDESTTAAWVAQATKLPLSVVRFGEDASPPRHFAASYGTVTVKWPTRA